jgi:hypothetical protein
MVSRLDPEHEIFFELLSKNLILLSPFTLKMVFKEIL